MRFGSGVNLFFHTGGLSWSGGPSSLTCKSYICSWDGFSHARQRCQYFRRHARARETNSPSKRRSYWVHIALVVIFHVDGTPFLPGGRGFRGDGLGTQLEEMVE